MRMTLQELSDWYFTYYAPNNLKEITIYNYTNIANRFLPCRRNKKHSNFTLRATEQD